MASYEDPIVREVHETRARLLAKHGGPDGYAEHLRDLEARLDTPVVVREPRPPVSTAKKIS